MRKRGKHPENIEKSIFYYKNALIVRNPIDTPLDWAKTQLSLGSAYRLGVSEDLSANQEQAIEAPNQV